MYQKGMDLGDSGMNMRVATGYPGDRVHSVVENGALTFDMDYAQWLNEHQQLINDLRRATNNSSMEDHELAVVVEGVTAHYDELFRLKSRGTKADAFHMLFGTWKTPAETFFMWLGGFRPSEFLEILYAKQLEPFTDIEMIELSNLSECSRMAEWALSEGMEAMQRSLSNILCSNSAKAAQDNMVHHHEHMELGMSKLHNLEGLLLAADTLRQQTLQQLQRILTPRRAARAFLVINDHISHLRNNLCRLADLNQETRRKSRSREKGTLIATEYPGDRYYSLVENGAMAFDKDYERWVGEHQHVINNLRTAFNSQIADDNDHDNKNNNNYELHAAILSVTSHYDELFRLKSIGTKADVFHMLSGTWKTPIERCFMWFGGFQSSQLIKMMSEQLEALTEKELMAMYTLQQCSSQAEDALSQGMEALQRSLFEKLSSSTSLDDVVAKHNMDQMTLAMSYLQTLETFLLQADLLRNETLNQLQRILTMRHLAQAFLVVNDYISRLKNLKCGSSSTPSIIESKL